MALLGTGFDPNVPANADDISQGAAEIRDVKQRLKDFVSVLFNPDTGELLDGIIDNDALSTTGVTAGTYNSFTVNNKGRITAASNVVNTNPVPFHATATLTSAAASTPIILVDESAVPSGKKLYLTGFIAKVNGGTGWATTNTVKIQDTTGTPIDFVTLAVAGLTSNALLGLFSSNVSVSNAVALGTGGGDGQGLKMVGDINGTGSDLVVTVFGFIK